MKLLVQLQLSNYDAKGAFILEADSGYQMCMGRIREMLKLVPDMEIDVLGAERYQLLTQPEDINPDIFATKRVKYIGIRIIPNALITRFDFNVIAVATILGLGNPRHVKYDWVYINDPMHLRNFKAMFNVYGKYQPKFAVHSHFIDNPACPKFPTDASLWLGQVEASIRADINFWQCQSALDIYKEEVGQLLQEAVVDDVMLKSFAWDDGYSSAEVNLPIEKSKLRFDTKEVLSKLEDKTVIFVPNRIGGRGRSSDYTNCGKFIFEHLEELHKKMPNVVVICGNPSQKFSNKELEDEFGKFGFMSLVPDSLRRDEYLWVAKHSKIVLGLYDQDSYGGTASRECVDLGCIPVWLDNYEYSAIMADWSRIYRRPAPNLVKTNFSNLVDVIYNVTNNHKNIMELDSNIFRELVYDRCSYESTTKVALERMGILAK